MATQVIRQQTSIGMGVVEVGEVWEDIASFFSSVAHVLEPYFGPARLDYLDKEYRDTLSVREKAITDADLFGLSTH